MPIPLDRRTFLAGAASLAQIGSSQDVRPVSVGFIGTGNRGTSLLRTMLSLPGLEVPAVCDINEANLARAQGLVEKTGRKRPEGYSSGVEDYLRLLNRQDLHAVIIATPWELHTPMAVAAMKAGKYAGVEVPAALRVEECWELVNTSEKTGVPCMMLENVCYFRNVLMVLNMIRQGLLGELLHSEVGYQHFVRGSQFTKDGDLTWRGTYAASKDGNQYPTHPIGPAGWWMNINRGDRFTYLNSMSSNSRGPHVFATGKFGAGHASAKRTFAQGDVNTTLIKTENGLTVTLYYNTQSPRPYDLILRVQGTGGIYSGTLDKVFVDGRSPAGRNGEPAWEDAAGYYERYEHPLWKRLSTVAASSGHGGGDYITLHEFVRAVREKTATPIDVYDSATWSVITPLSVQSVASRSAPIDFPDFTRGKWRTAKPVTVE
jgi:predicted dehydrogenase